ncbi:MAG: alpha/beta fold hydrolase [Acidimicrobiia bacterium]|nr:alpha/beta fold hydrolase [Acidimicrobiia bacterium]
MGGDDRRPARGPASTCAEHPGAPVVLVGHSMGSFLAQRYVQRWGDDLAGVVYSGSSHGLEGAEMILEMLAGPAAEAPDEPSELFAATFAGYNVPFADEVDATGYEWLSRDAAEVRAYVEDPWCGDDQPLSNGFVADMIQGMVDTWDPAPKPGCLSTCRCWSSAATRTPSVASARACAPSRRATRSSASTI